MQNYEDIDSRTEYSKAANFDVDKESVIFGETYPG